MQYNFAVVGATGMVGRKILQVMAKRDFPLDNLYLFASEKSDGTVLSYKGTEIVVHTLRENDIPHVDYAIFSAGSVISDKFAPIFRDKGAVVIDNSSRWRHDESVPLVIPEVNADALLGHHGIVANPNCSTIQAITALAPIQKSFGLKRVIFTTFQSVSGAGRRGFVDLINGSHGIKPKVFPRDIFANVIPQIGDFDENGNSTEENKMIFESKKILADRKIEIAATCVRVPVFFCHAESVNFTTRKDCSLEDVKNALKNARGVVLSDGDGEYVTPVEVEDRDEVFVSRIRRDFSRKNAFAAWIVADNVRKGAATNAVQIAETLIRFKNSGGRH